MAAYSFFVYTTPAGAAGLDLGTVTFNGVDKTSALTPITGLGTDNSGNQISGWYIDDDTIPDGANTSMTVTTGDGTDYGVGSYNTDGSMGLFEMSGNTTNGFAMQNYEFATVLAIDDPNTVDSVEIWEGGGLSHLTDIVPVITSLDPVNSTWDMGNMNGNSGPVTLNVYEVKWRDWLADGANTVRELSVETSGFTNFSSYQSEAEVAMMDYMAMDMPGTSSNIIYGQLDGQSAVGATTPTGGSGGSGGGGASLLAGFTITGSGVTSVKGSGNYAASVNATHPSGFPFTYELLNTSTINFNIDGNTGVVTTSNSGNTGPATVEVRAVDSNGDFSDTFTHNIVMDPPNQAPVFTNATSTTQTIANDSSANIYVYNVTDSDNDDATLNVSMSGNPNGYFNMRVGNEVFLTNPDGSTPAGSYTLTFTVTDTDGGSATTTLNVVVEDANAAPVLAAPTPLTTRIGNTAPVVDLSIGATDADGDTLTYALSGADAAEFVIDSATGIVTLDGTATEGIKNISATANDGSTDSAVVNYVITVDPAITVLPRANTAGSKGRMGRIGSNAKPIVNTVTEQHGNDYVNSTGAPMVLVPGDLATSLHAVNMQPLVDGGGITLTDGNNVITMMEGDKEVRQGTDNDDGSRGTVSDFTVTIPDGATLRVRWEEIV